MSKRKIEEQAMLAFSAAVNAGFITTYESVDEIDENAYEILEFMPDYSPDELSDKDFDYAVEILKSQLY